MGCVYRLGQSQWGRNYAVVGRSVNGNNSAARAHRAHKEAQTQEAVSHSQMIPLLCKEGSGLVGPTVKLAATFSSSR